MEQEINLNNNKFIINTKCKVKIVKKDVKRCSPVVTLLLQRLARWVQGAAVLTGTIGGSHTGSILKDQT